MLRCDVGLSRCREATPADVCREDDEWVPPVETESRLSFSCQDIHVHDCGLTCGGVYSCPGCRRTCGWCFGCADDMIELCDDCWYEVTKYREKIATLMSLDL
jgi:hypothetical protein